MAQQNYEKLSPPPYIQPSTSNPQVDAGDAPNPYVAPAPAPTPYPPPQYPPTTSQYPPFTGHVPLGQTYAYVQPPPGYPPQQGYGAPQFGAAPSPQQQQQVVVVSGQSQQPMVVQYVQSFAGHIVFACFVFWCCNPLFGLIAFILAS